jgi:hypothetical protein
VSYTISFDGQGGVAGFGKGKAAVRLTPIDGGTQLAYDVDAQVGGKIAQIGSRLVDAAASKIADEFFASFETKLTEQAAAAAAVATAAVAGAATSSAVHDAADHSGHAHASHNAHHAPAAEAPADNRGWLIGAVVLAAAAALIAYLVK